MAARKTRAPKKRGKQKAGKSRSPNSSGAPAAPEPAVPMGRPPKLVETDETIKKLANMAMAQCSQREAAAFLGVSLTTFKDFLANSSRAKEVWDSGPDFGRAALRRSQMSSALRGNVQMQKWLGVNMLGQRMRIDGRLSGPSGGPIKTINHNVNSDGPALKGKALADMYAATLNGGP
jgi:hypothetical protein